MAFRTGQILHILFALRVHGFACREIGLAITIRTLAENLDFYYHMPPLVVKTKKPANKGGWGIAPAGRRIGN
jgi:hypothetical protein